MIDLTSDMDCILGIYIYIIDGHDSWYGNCQSIVSNKFPISDCHLWFWLTIDDCDKRSPISSRESERERGSLELGSGW